MKAAAKNSITAHREMVRKGLGVAVMPLFMVERDIKRGVLKALYPEERLEWPIVLVCRRNVLSENAETFLSSFSEIVEQVGDRPVL